MLVTDESGITMDELSRSLRKMNPAGRWICPVHGRRDHKEEIGVLVMHAVHPVRLLMFAFTTQVPFRVLVKGNLTAGRAKVVGLALVL